MKNDRGAKGESSNYNGSGGFNNELHPLYIVTTLYVWVLQDTPTSCTTCTLGQGEGVNYLAAHSQLLAIKSSCYCIVSGDRHSISTKQVNFELC